MVLQTLWNTSAFSRYTDLHRHRYWVVRRLQVRCGYQPRLEKELASGHYETDTGLEVDLSLVLEDDHPATVAGPEPVLFCLQPSALLLVNASARPDYR